MSDELQKTIDTSQKPDSVEEEGEPKPAQGDALSGLNREVSEKELKNNPAALKLILSNNDRLQREIIESRDYKDKYYQEREKASVLTETLKNLRESINSKFIMISIGCLMAGYLPTLWTKSEFYPLLVISAIFIMVGYFKK